MEVVLNLVDISVLDTDMSFALSPHQALCACAMQVTPQNEDQAISSLVRRSPRLTFVPDNLALRLANTHAPACGAHGSCLKIECHKLKYYRV